MNRKTKLWLIMGASLILIGCIIFAGVMTMLNFDFRKLSTSKYETNTYTITDKFSNILINTNTADITFALSDDDICKVESFEEKNIKHLVEVKDSTLTINVVDERKWFNYIGFDFYSPKLTVYLPKSEYKSLVIENSTGDILIPKDFKFDSADVELSTGDVEFYASVLELLKIKTSTGDIKVENVNVGSLDLCVSTGEIIASDVECDTDIFIKVSTGKTKLTDVKCKNITSSGGTGEISLSNVEAFEKFNIERSTGDISFENCDAQKLLIKTDTGDVKGSLLSDKVFITNTNTGDVDVPKTVSGGICEINTSTGDIKITVE